MTVVCSKCGHEFDPEWDRFLELSKGHGATGTDWLDVIYLTSGMVVVSDPCYDLNTSCQAILSNVRTGQWRPIVRHCNAGKWGIRIAALEVLHDPTFMTLADLPDYVEWEKVDCDIGVDSGQAGIFDKTVYRNDHTVEGDPYLDTKYDKSRWCDVCCDLTCSYRKAGILKGGAVSRTGFGDGSYDLFIMRHKESQEIVRIKIVFISDEEIADWEKEKLEQGEDNELSE